MKKILLILAIALVWSANADAMVVQHNMTAMNANRMLGVTSSQGKSTEKLSSGYKINRAADDAAGLSISEKMRKQIRGLRNSRLARVGGCIKPSAEQVAAVVSDDANNTYSATYGNKAPRVATGSGNCENLQAAESMIRDTDMASEMVNYSNQGVLSLLQ